MSLAVARVKVPLVAGGAAAAGLAGGLAVINRRRGSRRNGSFDFENVIATAQRLGSFGEELGRAATAIQRATEGSKTSK